MVSLSTVCLLAATLFSAEGNGVSVELASDTRQIDPGRSVFVTLTLRTPHGVEIAPPDLRERVRGFSLAEDDEIEKTQAADGSVTRVVRWRLVPQPCAERYGIAPFAVGEKIVAGPVKFEMPAPRERVTGDFELDLEKFWWPRVKDWLQRLTEGPWICGLLVALGLAVGLVYLIRRLIRKIREHRMSPIERAWVELDALLKKGLPGRGRYKDFYVELTMVVRRYVERKYGIRAPHLTTEEFLAEIAQSNNQTIKQSNNLSRFLESADLVKFAGVKATPEMADDATESARGYLKSDDVAEKGRTRDARQETREPGRETGDGRKSK